MEKVDIGKFMGEINSKLAMLYVFFIPGITALYSMDLQTLKQDLTYQFLLLVLKGTLESFGFQHIFFGGVLQIETVYCGINEKIYLDLSEKTNNDELKQIIYTSEVSMTHENKAAYLQEKIQESTSRVPRHPNKVLYGVPFNSNFVVSDYKTKVNVWYVYYPHLHPVKANPVSIGRKDKDLDFLYNYMTLNLINAFDCARLGHPEDAVSDAWMAIQISLGYQIEVNNSKTKTNHPIEQLKALYSKGQIVEGKLFLSDDIINKLKRLYVLRCQIMHGEDITVDVNEVKELLTYVYIYYHYFLSYNDFNLVLKIAEAHLKSHCNPVVAAIIPPIVKLLAPLFFRK